jgi:hypothetical protein
MIRSTPERNNFSSGPESERRTPMQLSNDEGSLCSTPTFAEALRATLNTRTNSLKKKHPLRVSGV